MKLGNLELTQKEVDEIYLGLCHVCSKATFKVLAELDHHVSPDVDSKLDDITFKVVIEENHVIDCSIILPKGD